VRRSGSHRVYLATLTSQAESDFVVQNLNLQNINPWIGGLQPPGSAEPAGDWQWVTGEPWLYTNWSSGEPNEQHPGEDFLHIRGVNGKWNDHASTQDAYIVEYEPATWTSVTALVASDGFPQGQFGAAVAVDDNVVVVGDKVATGAGATRPGSACVFQRTGSTWNQVATLAASDGAPNAWFGSSVAIDGDTVIVGAPLADTPAGYRAGAAYIFEKPIGGWANMTETTKLAASDASPEDWFGNSVSLSGNYAVVGAQRHDHTAQDAGSAYVFRRSESGWAEVAELRAPDGQAGDSFGTSVRVEGDTIIVGAWNAGYGCRFPVPAR
jgi:hypothetical protein